MVPNLKGGEEDDSLMRWHMLISAALGKLRQDDYHQFHANLGYTANTKQTTKR